MNRIAEIVYDDGPLEEENERQCARQRREAEDAGGVTGGGRPCGGSMMGVSLRWAGEGQISRAKGVDRKGSGGGEVRGRSCRALFVT